MAWRDTLNRVRCAPAPAREGPPNNDSDMSDLFRLERRGEDNNSDMSEKQGSGEGRRERLSGRAAQRAGGSAAERGMELVRDSVRRQADLLENLPARRVLIEALRNAVQVHRHAQTGLADRGRDL
jgi:hypothetical protein